MDTAVVIPALNEAAGIGATLQSLTRQQDRDFRIVVVDNGSTDGTDQVVREFAAAHSELDLTVIAEPQKGTGAAADTGMRYAISAGATRLARTDADCVAATTWIAALRAGFGSGLQLIAGRLVPRRDEGLSGARTAVLTAAVLVAAAAGRVRPGNRGPQYVGPYLMAPGCNMAITSEAYLRAGGFPRTRIEELHEDRALVNAVRQFTPRYGLQRDAVVFGSSRRAMAWGLVRTLAWYADHRYRPTVVDIR